LTGVDDVTAPDSIDVPRWASEDLQRRTVTSSEPEIVAIWTEFAEV